MINKENYELQNWNEQLIFIKVEYMKDKQVINKLIDINIIASIKVIDEDVK